MKIFNRYILILSFFLVVYSSMAQENWLTYRVDEGFSFKVDVPEEMEIISKEIDTSLGMLKATTYVHQSSESSEDPNFLYIINFVEYPYGTFPMDSLDLKDEFLDESVTTLVNNVAGSLVYQSELNSPTGRLFRIKYNDGEAVIKGKAVLYKDVFITLQVFTHKDTSLNDNIESFLDSFKLLF